jgi:serine protease inhibitor
MRRLGRALFLGVGSLVWMMASGCSGSAPTPIVCSAPAATSSAAQALASANTAFAAAFFTPAATAVGRGNNVIFSPYSVSATLTMVDGGAAGETATQIQSVLELPGAAASIAPAYASIACDDETDGSSQGNQLSIANSLWAQEGMSFEHAFVSLLKNGYAAPLQQVDFAADPDSAMSTIDQWVSTQTQGKIPSLLQPGDVDTQTRIVLVNAVYFAGTWENGFDPSQTSPAPFTLSDGTRVQAPMMGGMVTAGGGSVQMSNDGPWLTTLELPYKGGALAMDILMPNGSLSDFEASLTADSLTKAIESASSNQGQIQVEVPKFTFTTRVALVPVLSAMGMKDVFEPNLADLSGIDGQHDLYVSLVVQQAFVQVDEQGTVAAAATSAGVGDTAAMVPTTINQPFLFVIRDTTNGSILFLGHVENPLQGS